MKEQSFYKLEFGFGELVKVVYKNKFAEEEQTDKGYFIGYEKGVVKLMFYQPTIIDRLKELKQSARIESDLFKGPIQRATESKKKADLPIRFMPYLIEDIIEIKKVNIPAHRMDTLDEIQVD
jgi:hypothetical protein